MNKPKKIVLSAILLLVLIGGALAANSKQILSIISGIEASNSPTITNGFLDKTKYVSGDSMLVTASVEDNKGIKEVKAEIDNEKGIDTVKLNLIGGDNKKGTWQAVWTVHDVTGKKIYKTKIIVTNLKEQSSEFALNWIDPIPNPGHTASSVGGTTDAERTFNSAGLYTFPSQIKVNSGGTNYNIYLSDTVNNRGPYSLGLDAFGMIVFNVAGAMIARFNDDRSVAFSGNISTSGNVSAATIKITGNSPGAGKLLTSNAVGEASWTNLNESDTLQTVTDRGRTVSISGAGISVTTSGSGNIAIAAESPDGYGVNGAGGVSGVWGQSARGSGVFGTTTIGKGVLGQSSDSSGVGVYGEHLANGKGVYGSSGSSIGVYGRSTSGNGVSGQSTSGYGVSGVSTTGRGVSCYGVSCGGNQPWTDDSDERLKKNITTIENALDKVKKLRGVNFEWNNEAFKGKKIGFIAQEVKDIIPEIVSQDTDGYYALQTSQLTAVLVEAIKEQQKQIEELRKEIEVLKSTNK